MSAISKCQMNTIFLFDSLQNEMWGSLKIKKTKTNLTFFRCLMQLNTLKNFVIRPCGLNIHILEKIIENATEDFIRFRVWWNINLRKKASRYFSLAFWWNKNYSKYVFFWFSSKTKFLYPNITFILETYVEKFQKYVQFFIGILTSQQIEPTSLFSFQVMISIQECLKISTLSFYVMFNVSLWETQITERWQLVSDL